MSECCVRCGARFACGSADPGTCWCAELPAVMPVLSALPAKAGAPAEGCLCRDCLRREIDRRFAERIGLCATCGHAKAMASKSGSPIYLCRLAARDRRFAKYPRLPMTACAGYEGVGRT